MALTQPSAQGTYGVLTQRGAAFLAPFAPTSDVRSGSENHIFGLKAINSETLSPVWTATVSNVQSRRPLQLSLSGADRSASISTRVRNWTGLRSNRLLGMAKTRWATAQQLGS